MSDNAGQQLAELARQGQMIEAIKLVREQTGCGLVEGKAAVEKLQRELAARSAGDATDEIRELLRAGRKIEAVKVYRGRTGTGLKEAKDAVDAIEAGL